MGLKEKIGTILLVTTALMSVSATSQAAATCKSTCDDKHLDCAKSKSEDICLPAWRQCKMACTGGQKAVTPMAAPVKVTTTTTIAPDSKTGSKVVSTKTKISK